MASNTSRAINTTPTTQKPSIRLEQPEALAAYSWWADPAWTRARIDTTIASGQQRTLALAVPMPVYVIYHPAWVDTAGPVHFRPDIYAYDTTPAEERHNAHAIPCG
jgi:murein L,D-transpeptidase YcbB/YkuD